MDLDSCCSLLQPLLVCGIAEQRHQLIANLRVISVEPILFGRAEHAEVDGARVDGAEGERFETKEFSVGRLCVLNG